MSQRRQPIAASPYHQRLEADLVTGPFGARDDALACIARLQTAVAGIVNPAAV